MAAYVVGAVTGLYLGASVRERYDVPSLAQLEVVIDQVFRKVPRSPVPESSAPKAPTSVSTGP